MPIIPESLEEQTALLQQYINECSNIVFFGGAGVSTESGIPDFRSTDGIYHQQWKYPPETILSATFFRKNPSEFYRFYREKILFNDIEPNPAHKKLAEMEQKGKLMAVITQNIDGLHQKAGSKEVYELHGTIHKNYCTKCHKFFDSQYIIDHKTDKNLPLCDSCSSIIKPDVVLYEESLPENTIEKTLIAITNADLLIIGGTSLSVYPAAGFIRYFQGKYIVLINRDPTPQDGCADLIIRNSIGKVLEGITV